MDRNITDKWLVEKRINGATFGIIIQKNPEIVHLLFLKDTYMQGGRYTMKKGRRSATSIGLIVQ